MKIRKLIFSAKLEQIKKKNQNIFIFHCSANAAQWRHLKNFLYKNKGATEGSLSTPLGEGSGVQAHLGPEGARSNAGAKHGEASLSTSVSAHPFGGLAPSPGGVNRGPLFAPYGGKPGAMNKILPNLENKLCDANELFEVSTFFQSTSSIPCFAPEDYGVIARYPMVDEGPPPRFARGPRGPGLRSKSTEVRLCRPPWAKGAEGAEGAKGAKGAGQVGQQRRREQRLCFANLCLSNHTWAGPFGPGLRSKSTEAPKGATEVCLQRMSGTILSTPLGGTSGTSKARQGATEGRKARQGPAEKGPFCSSSLSALLVCEGEVRTTQRQSQKQSNSGSQHSRLPKLKPKSTSRESLLDQQATGCLFFFNTSSRTIIEAHRKNIFCLELVNKIDSLELNKNLILLSGQIKSLPLNHIDIKEGAKLNAQEIYRQLFASMECASSALNCCLDGKMNEFYRHLLLLGNQRRG